uniref:Uncharacterized protein n=1 Tax=Mycena chlorophos TaxID=658473 RepID=A0ABQ0M8S5_MYCCL|nr:predicted protein [Mycena chlorophos]
MFPSDQLVPGTPSFFSALLAHVRATPSVPVDPVVLQSLLLCLIAGEKHLVLRTPDRDLRLVAKLAFLTLSSIFGLPTHKLKVRPAAPANTSSAPFLRSLFLPWSSPIDPQDEPSAHKSTHKRARTNSSWTRSTGTTPRPRRRSASSSNEPVATSTTSNPFDSTSHEALLSTMATTVPHSPKNRNPLPHAVSDPTPIRPKPDRSTALQPKAVVVSGLENATLSSQRALARALAEHCVILEDEDGDETYDEVWNLPDGFIIVYVCAFDPWEQPNIDKTLLDKFAMSATVSPHHSIRALLSGSSRNSASYRNSPALHSTPLPQSPPQPPHHSHTISFPVGHHHHHHHPLLQQHTIVPPGLLQDLRATYQRTHLSSMLDIYTLDLFSAARHHPQLDGMLLSSRAVKDAIDLARAGRVIGGDLTGMELVREDASADYASTSQDPPKTASTGHMNGNGEPELTSSNGHAHRYQSIEVVVEEVDGETTPPGSVRHEPEEEPPILELSEADIARIAPRVMTHRVRVRDGPHDEMLGSLGYPAVEDREELESRITIKEILVRILSEV